MSSCILLLEAGCSTDSTTPQSAAALAISGAQQKIAELATPPAGAVSRDNASDWNTSSGFLSDPRNSGGDCQYTEDVNPKTRIQVDFTETATRCNGSAVNVFGKINQTMQVICTVSNFITASSSDALPSSGTISATPAQIATYYNSCGAETFDASQVSSVSITYETPSDTSNYDRVFTFSASGRDGDSDSETFFLRFDSSAVRVASGSYSGETSGSQRMLVNWDRTTDVLKAEYISGMFPDFKGYYFHRLYYDGVADLGRVLSDIKIFSDTAANAGSATGQIVYVATAKPNVASQDMGLSMDFWGSMGGGAYLNSGDYNLNACVKLSDGTLSSTPTPSSNAFSCNTMTAKSLGAYTLAGPLWTLVNTSSWSVMSSSNPPGITWNMDTMLTSAP